VDDRLLAVRERYGEDTYDWFLYAAGRSNRVKVEGVLGGSAAADAGFRSGDVIVSYDGERIFKPGALVQGTLGGRLGDHVDVEVMRGGELVSLRVPRGPLGVRLGRDTVEPAPLP
jgi:S1-C subfamily serine protease